MDWFHLHSEERKMSSQKSLPEYSCLLSWALDLCLSDIMVFNLDRSQKGTQDPTRSP